LGNGLKIGLLEFILQNRFPAFFDFYAHNICLKIGR
jgi:hypothetical protein